MDIGIIVYSQTGNTYGVAEKLKEALSAKGHNATVERITAVDDKQMDVNQIKLTNSPDVSKYDVLILGSPIMAFSLASVMKAYLKSQSSLKGKKTMCFITKGLPFKWTGGNGAINTLKKACENKGASVTTTGIVVWPSKQRENMINELAESFCRAI